MTVGRAAQATRAGPPDTADPSQISGRSQALDGNRRGCTETDGEQLPRRDTADRGVSYL